ncbi:GspH/FimT family pseudopilin [Bacillus subtilis subsp. subtilis]|nr:GspH/FimT family pseudopilin [Bacillus subtilis subsp. subtilis]
MHIPFPSRATALGLGLVQLLVVMGIVAILAALALPSFQEVLDRTRADSVRMQLMSAFASARSTAISRRHAVSVCASHDGQHCTDDWSAGWLLYRDRHHQAQPADPAEVLYYQAGNSAGPVRARATSGRPHLRYGASGRSFGRNLTITLCVRGERRGEVVVNNHGRARSQSYRDHQPCP